MKDRDQQLLWEAYLTDKAAKPDYIDADEDGDTKESMKKALQDKESGTEEVEETAQKDKEDVQEEMDNLEFSASGRENPEQMVFNAVLSWMRADTEGLTTPEDFEGYSMSTAFDDAKDFIKQALQDISFSEVKAHLNSTVDMGAGYDDPEEMAFQRSVDDDIRHDDSRLNDMPPREPGV